jgi:uncharacterized protein YjbJ (UPF0337 family)
MRARYGRRQGPSEGRTKEVEGKINEATGRVVGDKKLAGKAKVQEIGGEAQAEFGDLKQNVKDPSKTTWDCIGPRMLASVR